jgi:uncharacterized coiled-coil protein SlyX
MTTTITRQHAGSSLVYLTRATVSLTLSSRKEPLTVRIQNFCTKLRTFNHFSKEEQEKMAIWSQKLEAYLPRILPENIPMETTLILAIIASEILMPALAAETQPQEQTDVLLELDEDLMELLQEMLPEGQEANQFIEEYILKADEDTALQEELQMRQTVLEEEIRHLYQHANHTSDLLVALFNALKKELSAVIAHQKAISSELHARLDRLTIEMERVQKNLKADISKATQDHKKLKEYDSHFNKMLQEFKDVLRLV